MFNAYNFLGRSLPAIPVFYIFFLLNGFLSHSQAETSPEVIGDYGPILARAEIGSDSTITLSVPGLSIFARRTPFEDGWVMELSGKTKQGNFSIRHVFQNVVDYPDEVVIVELDPSNSSPEIMFSAFTGGAHCCSRSVIASDVNGYWKTTFLNELDGGPPNFEDVDQDNVAELVSYDQSFLYAFDCYACSWAPLKIEVVRQGNIINVTNDPLSIKRIKKQLKIVEDAANEDENLWRQNGFLAGWVALKALLKEEHDAWKKMLLFYNRDSDFLELKCFDKAKKIEDCLKDEIETVPFPVSLESHLLDHGYLKRPIRELGRNYVSMQTQTGASTFNQIMPDSGNLIAQKALLVLESVDSGVAASPINGRITWRLVTTSASSTNQAELRSIAAVEFSDVGLSADLIFRRDSNVELVKSYIIELIFSLKEGNSTGDVIDIRVPELRSDEALRGKTLIGSPIRTANNYFFINLNSTFGAKNNNIHLLSSQNWFAVPIRFANGRRGIMMFEKGNSGDRIIKEVIKQWDKND